MVVLWCGGGCGVVVVCGFCGVVVCYGGFVVGGLMWRFSVLVVLGINVKMVVMVMMMR